MVNQESSRDVIVVLDHCRLGYGVCVVSQELGGVRSVSRFRGRAMWMLFNSNVHPVASRSCKVPAKQPRVPNF